MVYVVVRRGRGRPRSRSTRKPAGRTLHGFNTSRKTPVKAQLQFGEIESYHSGGSVSSGVADSRVQVREQYENPPAKPTVLVLLDEMMESFHPPDRYMQCYAMVGYDMIQYAADIREGMIDISSYSYIIVFLGNMSLDGFDSRRCHKEISDLVEAITAVNVECYILISGLVPRPVDWPRSRLKAQNYSRALQLAAESLHKSGYNTAFVQVFNLFLSKDLQLCNVHINYVEQMYLSGQGIRIVRAQWLCHLGFFPPKAE